MKRSPLSRKTPLRRKRAKPRRSGRVRDRDYLLRVKGLPCLLAPYYAEHRCDGPTQADHAGERPYGRKADDDTGIPMCPCAHRQRTDYTGFFAGWDKHTMRAWCDRQIFITQQLLGYRQEAA